MIHVEAGSGPGLRDPRLQVPGPFLAVRFGCEQAEAQGQLGGGEMGGEPYGLLEGPEGMLVKSAPVVGLPQVEVVTGVIFQIRIAFLGHAEEREGEIGVGFRHFPDRGEEEDR